MGGCRCSFRKCHVSTAKYPRMHFFRLPLKEPDRLKKWIEYSQLQQIYQYTESRKKNTVICARHFRIENFMNYKMEKLAPNAIPTLIRLTNYLAIDFELDIEKGVLVTLQKTKMKHLIPPDDFESPLYLENDRVLINMLNEFHHRLAAPNSAEEVEYIETGYEDEQFLTEKPVKSTSNTIEILETIQLAAPLKRTSESSIDDIQSNPAHNVNNKKFKILNSAQPSIPNENKDETTVVLTSRHDINDTDHFISDNVEYLHSNNIQNQGINTFSTANSEGNDEDLEFFEIHKGDRESFHDLETLDSGSTIVELKTDTQSFAESIKQQLVAAQYEILELKRQSEEISHLQFKISLLEKENFELKETCKGNNELRKKLLDLERKNILMAKIVKEQKALKEEIAKYSEENKQLKKENESIALLKEKLLSKQKETEELKEKVESLKRIKPNDSECTANEQKLKEEISSLRKQGNEILFAKSKLQKIEADFNKIKCEKESLQQKHSELEQKYLKLQALLNQEATVSTSLGNITEEPKIVAAPTSTASLTKAQLFNGIKRYLSSAMVSLLRMEMFGSSEREWKSDERQVAVDILRLGETIYKYFTDEWRFRLPALRDVRNWLSQSVQMYDEEDL